MFKKGIICLAILSAASSSTFAAISNGDFQLGLTDWSYQGPFASVDGVDVAPGFVKSAVVQAGRDPDVYSTLRQSFSLAAGEGFTGYARWIGYDYLPFNDDGYVSVTKLSDLGVHQNTTFLFQASIGSVGGTHDIYAPAKGDWTAFSYTAAGAGDYLVEVGVRNVGDNDFNSALRVDFGIAAAVPEPETEAMLLAGLGVLGFIGRRRRQAGERAVRT